MPAALPVPAAGPTIDILEHRGLVRSLVRRFADRAAALGADLADLEQRGLLALHLAAQRFNPGRGVKFSSFAYPAVLGAIKGELTWWERHPLPAFPVSPSGETFEPEARQEVVQVENRERIERLLAGLPERTRTMIRLHFGIAGVGCQLTFEEIGERYNLSGGRCQQIVQRGLKKIRRGVRREMSLAP
jgi:RNA polymerase sigma factor (sigma-70 family)